MSTDRTRKSAAWAAMFRTYAPACTFAPCRKKSAGASGSPASRTRVRTPPASWKRCANSTPSRSVHRLSTGPPSARQAHVGPGPAARVDDAVHDGAGQAGHVRDVHRVHPEREVDLAPFPGQLGHPDPRRGDPAVPQDVRVGGPAGE